MKANIAIRLWDWYLRLRFGRIITVMGINSNLKDGNHILMWEFDITDEQQVIKALRLAQREYNLPEIRVARSHPEGGFHAYCFKRLSWLHSLTIVASTPWVDEKYISMCAHREHWTLRLSDKGQGEPAPVYGLPSQITPDCDIDELESWVRYKTWYKGHPAKNIGRDS